jgi:hypothetical protein
MRSWWLVLLSVAACGFPRPPDVDPSGDASTNVLDASLMRFGTFVTVEFSPTDVPTTPLVWSSDTDIDTDTSPLCNTHTRQAVDYCVVAATDITLGGGATLRAHGSKPIVLLATAVFNLQGTIDVSSRHDRSSPGAGAAAASACQGTPAMGHSGGFGGSFGGKGGDGGTPVSTTGEAGGVASLPRSFPSVLRGGCPGGNGVNAQQPGPGGSGGSGGGAVALIAASLRMGGKINASGAGGLGGPVYPGSGTGTGGGGGGSGGMIVIDTSSITPTSSDIWVFANGGGGGQGGTGNGTGSGAGDDGMESPDPFTQAPAGVDTSRSGGYGGKGGAGTAAVNGDPARSAVNSGGGGAGGGGSGFIRSPPIPGALFAPFPTVP